MICELKIIRLLKCGINMLFFVSMVIDLRLGCRYDVLVVKKGKDDWYQNDWVKDHWIFRTEGNVGIIDIKEIRLNKGLFNLSYWLFFPMIFQRVGREEYTQKHKTNF